MSQRRRQVALGDGHTMLMSNSDIGSVTFHKPVRYTSLSFPRSALMPLVPRLEDAVMRPLPRNGNALQLLQGYVEMLAESPMPETPELRGLAAAHVHDLLALAIGASRDAAAIAEGRGVRVARLAAIKADIAAHLGERGLTVGAVAARQRLSPRYVQMLFEAEGTTFSRYVLGRRLVWAHRMLTDPRHARSTISRIALEAGFGDLSTFDHAFRRLYGASPSDVRAAAQRGDQR
jgi:AraC-like DNA-binding protein